MHPLEKLKDKWQDEWVQTVCSVCLHHCTVRVRVVNGVVVKVEGDPSNPSTRGHICAKAQSIIARQYDPHRVTRPMMRGNSEKGLGVDPKWKEVSWDEVWEIIVPKLKKIYRENPNKLLYSCTDWYKEAWLTAWGGAVFGTANNFFSDMGVACGGGYHPVMGLMAGSFASQPDWYYIKYLILLGCGDGFDSHLHIVENIRRAADARMRGMKLVVVDPRMSAAALKADEWVPIRPATSLYFALALCHVMIWELKRYDEWFLKYRTNAPYLIDEKGDYVRDKATKKPMVWDSVDNKAKPLNVPIYEDPTIKDFALEGEYEVDGVKCKPAFHLIKDSMKDYTPERASQITTIPAETIRRIAKEFVENAHIGEWIEIDGVEYPYRPVALQWYRGAHGHEYSMQANLAFKYVNLLVGSCNVPGGLLDIPLGKDPHIDAWSRDYLGWIGPAYCRVEPDEDGVTQPLLYELRPPMPIRYPPQNCSLLEYRPVGLECGHLYTWSILEPEKMGITYKPEVALLIHNNVVWNAAQSLAVAEAIKKLDLVISMDVVPFTETTQLADILLPDYTYLEDWSIEHCEMPFMWGYVLRRPVLKPPPTCMSGFDFLCELSDRLGILDKFNGFLNSKYIAPFGNKHLLELNRRYTLEEFLDRWMKSMFGDEYGLDWFKKHGHNLRHKRPEELYWPFGRPVAPKDCRIPIYLEFLKRQGDALEAKFKEWGYPKEYMKTWVYPSYSPIPKWQDIHVHQPKDPGYDLYVIYYKSAQLVFGENATVSWISEHLQKHRPDLVAAIMNPETARKKGINDGDQIVIESDVGRVKAAVHLTEGVHPDVIGLSNAGKPYANHPYAIKTLPTANILTNGSLEYTCKASGCPETTNRVRVVKPES